MHMAPYPQSQKQDANGKPIAGRFEWTALDRRQKLAVLQQLPEKLHVLFPEESVQAISSLWKVHVHTGYGWKINSLQITKHMIE